MDDTRTRTPVTLQKKWLFLTYCDSEEKIQGPAILLNELAEQLNKYQPYYGICGEEKAPSTGMKHFHVIICCRNQVRSRNGQILEIKGIKPHIEKINNNLKKIIQYVLKEGNAEELNKEQCPFKLELMTKEEKNKLLLTGDLKRAFLDGTIGAVEVIRAYKIRGIFEMQAKPEPFKKKLILWFKGETGEGKTRTAVEIAEKYQLDYWMSNETLKWFDGFNGQQLAIIDDFRKSMLGDWNYLLRLLDGYNLVVQVKGGYNKWNPRIVIITTPATPAECFQWVNKSGEIQDWDRQDQLERRLTFEDEEQVYNFPLWDEDKKRLIETVEKFLGTAEPEEDWSMILPEPTQIDED